MSLHRRIALVVAASVAFAASVLSAQVVQGQSLQDRLDRTESALGQEREREGVLTSELESLADQIQTLEVEVADLRNREAVAAEELAQKQAALDEAQVRLAALRARLDNSVRALEQRLVAMYKTGEPDLLTVVLASDGFDDLLERTEFYGRLQENDSEIVARVRSLRNELVSTVATIKESRNAIAARKRELEVTRTSLEAKSEALSAARSQRESALADVRSRERELEGNLSEISKQIEKQLASSSPSGIPAGPIQGGSGDMIWPINGTLTSSFGPRWGRIHEGLDLAAPGGTPIRAAKSGEIVLAAPSGGYGNYTCIDHGGGLSTCYAHQSAFEQTSGSIARGSILGYVGTTGSSTGDHLHFEVRVNGSAVDPMGYL